MFILLQHLFGTQDLFGFKEESLFIYTEKSRGKKCLEVLETQNIKVWFFHKKYIFRILNEEEERNVNNKDNRAALKLGENQFKLYRVISACSQN